MLRTLHWKLTLTFLGATLLLLLLVGGSAYTGLRSYLERRVDLDLNHSMTTQFQLFGFSLPPELAQSELEWREDQGAAISSFVGGALPVGEEAEEGEEGEGEGATHEQHELLENAYASDLALIFVLPLDRDGNLLFNPNPYTLPMQPDKAGSAAALETGNDLRSVNLPNGQRVRLLSYRTSPGGQPALLQVGRLLAEQDRVLGQLSASFGLIGALVLALAGVGSWWLAARTLRPAQQAWDQQQTFVANASHELRTPLTLMRASAEVALRGERGSKQTELLNDVLKEADYMGLLVEDLLLLSRLDGGRLHLDMESIAVSGFLQELKAQAGKLAGGSQVNVREGEGVIRGDRARLRQVLLILLDNALKHNPAGTRVDVWSQRVNGKIEIAVKDEGQGIPAEHLDHIFERFYQIGAETGVTHSHGLGLSIAKGLVDLHKGALRVESKKGQGSQFTVSLPGEA
ncbi:MAG: HAMP domain-containing sensor histidine kinase [Anaerolineales bacterium]